MRQSGYYAAAGLYALKHHVDRLEEDHRHAEILAEAAASSSWAEIDPQQVETNILIVTVEKGMTAHILSMLRSRNILAGAVGKDRIRFVTHLGVDREMTEKAASAISSLTV